MIDILESVAWPFVDLVEDRDSVLIDQSLGSLDWHCFFLNFSSGGFLFQYDRSGSLFELRVFDTWSVRGFSIAVLVL